MKPRTRQRESTREQHTRRGGRGASRAGSSRTPAPWATPDPRRGGSGCGEPEDHGLCLGIFFLNLRNEHTQNDDKTRRFHTINPERLSPSSFHTHEGRRGPTWVWTRVLGVDMDTIPGCEHSPRCGHCPCLLQSWEADQAMPVARVSTHTPNPSVRRPSVSVWPHTPCYWKAPFNVHTSGEPDEG